MIRLNVSVLLQVPLTEPMQKLNRGLAEGDEIVLSMSPAGKTAAASSTTTSPFMPQRPGARR